MWKNTSSSQHPDLGGWIYALIEIHYNIFQAFNYLNSSWKFIITNHDFNIWEWIQHVCFIHDIYSHFKYRTFMFAKIHIWFEFGCNISCYMRWIIINWLSSTVNISMAKALHGRAMPLCWQWNGCSFMFNSLRWGEAYMHQKLFHHWFKL